MSFTRKSRPVDRVAIRLRFIACVLAFACAARAVEAASPHYRIACRVELANDPSLTGPMEQLATEQIQRAFEAALGSDHAIRFLDAREFIFQPLESLDAATLAETWAGPERLLLVHIRREDNWYVVEAREYDSQFQLLGAAVSERSMQRDMLPLLVSRAVLQAFAPIARVQSATGTHVRVEFLGGKLDEYRGLLGLDGNVGLQIIREESGTHESSRATRYRRTFLAVRKWQGSLAECELIGPDTGVFAELGSASVQFFARPVSGGKTTPRVQVVRKDSRQPHEGTEVFVSPDQYSTDSTKLKGLTDRDGMIAFDPAGDGVQFVAVRYEGMILKAPLLPGASPDPLTFELPTRGRRADYVRPLKQLIQEIEDQYLVDVRLRDELKSRAESKELTEVRKLLDRGRRQRITLAEVEERVREVEQRAKADGEDVSVMAADVRDFAAKRLASQLDQLMTAYSKWADEFDKTQKVEELRGRIKQLTQDMEWESLEPLYEQLVTIDPESKTHADQLRKLRKALEIKGPEHQQARDFVDSQVESITSRELAGRWKEIEQAAKALLAARDHLTLLKLRRAMNGWARELAQDVKGLVDQIQTAGQDEDHVRNLRTRIEQLDQLNRSLQNLHKEIQDFLGKLDL